MTMEFYKLYNTYANYSAYLKDAIFMEQTPSIVDFGTAMINKRKCKRKKK